MEYKIYNPFSRKGKTVQTNTSFVDCSNPTQMNELKNKLNNKDTIIVYGGDGTLNFLLNNYPFILEYSIILKPYGSGNDFYNALDNQSYYYTLNNKYNFVNTFGLGFDANVCLNVNSATKKNKLSYIIEAFKGINNYKPIDLEITYNNKKHHYQKVWLCSLQNGPYFGGGLKVAKDADTSRPELELCIAHNLNKFKVIILLFFVKINLVHLFKKHFFSIKVTQVSIKNNTPRLIQLDGDTFTIDTDIILSATNKLNIKR